MAARMVRFEEWLATTLRDLNTDQEIFGSYIYGIVDGDDTDDEKLEALEAILMEITKDDVVALGKTILNKWIEYMPKATETKSELDVSAHLASIMEKQSQSVSQDKKLSDEEKKYREIILAQYSQVSDSEVDELNGNANDASASSNAASTVKNIIPVKNTNADDVLRAEKEKREKNKSDMEKKKAQEKASREKQKQQQQERKEREKKRTQKGERKR